MGKINLSLVLPDAEPKLRSYIEGPSECDRLYSYIIIPLPKPGVMPLSDDYTITTVANCHAESAEAGWKMLCKVPIYKDAIILYDGAYPVDKY